MPSIWRVGGVLPLSSLGMPVASGGPSISLHFLHISQTSWPCLHRKGRLCIYLQCTAVIGFSGCPQTASKFVVFLCKSPNDLTRSQNTYSAPGLYGIGWSIEVIRAALCIQKSAKLWRTSQSWVSAVNVGRIASRDWQEADRGQQSWVSTASWDLLFTQELPCIEF